MGMGAPLRRADLAVLEPEPAAGGGRRRPLRRGPERDGADRRMGDPHARLLRLCREAASALLDHGGIVRGLRRVRSGRPPLALLACAGLLLTAWLGWWLFAPQVGLLAAVALSSAGLYFFLGRFLTPDLPLTVFLLAASALILR